MDQTSRTFAKEPITQDASKSASASVEELTKAP